MKLYASPSSPYVQKVLVCAHELGLAERIETLPSAAHPVRRDANIRKQNPLGQVPTLLADDGTALYDSRVICEYLDHMAGGTLFGEGAVRWRNLTDAALGDGVLGGALLARYEDVARPAAMRWDDWRASQLEKARDAVARLEAEGSPFADRVDIGAITFACALSYLDFRFPDVAWRPGAPNVAAWFAKFSTRPSMQATKLSG